MGAPIELGDIGPSAKIAAPAQGITKSIGERAKDRFAMLTAFIFVCSIMVTPDLRDCNSTNARVVMRVPAEYSNAVTCAMHGQAYLAETAVGRNLNDKDRVKVVCVRPEKMDEMTAQLPSE